MMRPNVINYHSPVMMLNPADVKHYGCHTNSTLCGEEMKCIQTPTSVYCRCKEGFQKIPGENACRGNVKY